MRLKGVLDNALGNFLCLRGYAPMGILEECSAPDSSYQRDLLTEQREKMVAFLSQAEFLFFPEVILCTTLSESDETEMAMTDLFLKVRGGESFQNLKFDNYSLSCAVTKTRGKGDDRAVELFRSATLQTPQNLKQKFWRIDGNHRLSAATGDARFQDYNVPFCLIFFRNLDETQRFSPVLFHNINYKQVPLTMEQNLRLILDEPEMFSDEDLKTTSSFGWAYYLARRIRHNNNLDFELLPNLKPFLGEEPRTFLVEQLTFLLDMKVLSENEESIKRLKSSLVRVNALLEAHPILMKSTNRGLLAALVYYELTPSSPVASFVRWVSDNHLHLIPKSNASDLIQIFDQVLASRKRTIFVSMAFNKTETENHYKIIENVCRELNDQYKLQPRLHVERVDWFHDGTSYDINDKIIDMMSDCGLLIGNLTYFNPNVYHEIGFIMGKAKAEGKDAANMLLFLDESLSNKDDMRVGFNLGSIKQIRFSSSEVFRETLRKNIERFFQLGT